MIDKILLGRSLLKQVTKEERISIPNKTQWPQAVSEFSKLRKDLAEMKPIRDYTPKQIGDKLLIVLELMGWLWIGEIIGRRHFMGYENE